MVNPLSPFIRVYRTENLTPLIRDLDYQNLKWNLKIYNGNILLPEQMYRCPVAHVDFWVKLEIALHIFA